MNRLPTNASSAARGLGEGRRDHRRGENPTPTFANDGETGKIQPYPGSGTPSKRIWMRSVRPRVPSKYARAATITAGALASRPSRFRSPVEAPVASTAIRALITSGRPACSALITTPPASSATPVTTTPPSNCAPLRIARSRTTLSRVIRGTTTFAAAVRRPYRGETRGTREGDAEGGMGITPAARAFRPGGRRADDPDSLLLVIVHELMIRRVRTGHHALGRIRGTGDHLILREPQDLRIRVPLCQRRRGGEGHERAKHCHCQKLPHLKPSPSSC